MRCGLLIQEAAMGRQQQNYLRNQLELRVHEANGEVCCIAAMADHFDVACVAFLAAAQCYTYARIALQDSACIVGEVERRL